MQWEGEPLNNNVANYQKSMKWMLWEAISMRLPGLPKILGSFALEGDAVAFACSERQCCAVFLGDIAK